MIASLRLRPAESQEDLHIQTLSHGITLNMTMSKGESIEAILPEVIEAISKILSQDQRTLVRIIILVFKTIQLRNALLQIFFSKSQQ